MPLDDGLLSVLLPWLHRSAGGAVREDLAQANYKEGSFGVSLRSGGPVGLGF